MRTEIAPGVNLTVLASEQFKTTRIEVHFIAPADPRTISARTLLTSLLETSTAKYPTQSALSAELEEMYGANFGIGVNKDGQLHRVTVSLGLVNDQFAQMPLLQAGFDLLKEVLFAPLMPAGQFDHETFVREQANLLQYLGSLAEDRQMQAGLALQRVHFAAAPAQALPSFGDEAGLSGVTEQGLVTTYQDMLAHDQIELIVLGAVDEAAVITAVRGLGLPARTAHEPALTYDQPISAALREATAREKLNQAKLNLGYHVDTDLFGPRYYANVVAEALFGGSPLSLLFTNVREKASLAYYASSVLDPLRHFMMVQTGIDADQRERVQQLIAAQLQLVQTGDFSADRLTAVKSGLLSMRRGAYDSPRFLARQALLRALTPGVPATFADYQARIEAVDAQAVAEAAAGMQLQSVYFLDGEEPDERN